ncbi:MAG: DUF4143 domain-containing protein [Leptospirales bacterium]
MQRESGLVKSPKMPFSGYRSLRFSETEWSSPETLKSGAMSGVILEIWILSELLKGDWHNGRRLLIYFFRDKDAKENDLVFLKDGTLYPLGFKKTASPRK